MSDSKQSLDQPTSEASATNTASNAAEATEAKNLPKGYEPQAVETKFRKFWEDHASFTPDLNKAEDCYSIVIPPPNVTGALHIGHALNLTLQDVLCRHARQLGKTVLWVPGSDHAGIATQNVVEKALAKEGLNRHKLGREEFVKRIWQWKSEYGNRINDQVRRLGASVDWSHERFTMDEGLSKAVRKTFVDLYKDGYIYKGKYIINWCNRCHTALADDEVEHKNQKGKLYHVRYDFADGSGSLIIATTRPETIMGDTAVCVHPEDERYTAMLGKKIIVPVVNRAVPLIADKYVDKEFGTGALKVTPCHDPNDWALGHRHNLEFIQSIDDNGLMTAEAGPYEGLPKEECRAKIVVDLEAQGRLVKVEDIEHAVGHCYRCQTIVEPLVSEQWFVAATKLAPQARAAVPDQTKIYPETWAKTYYNWMDNIRDWCISRQIWWGHRIPAWTCADCGALMVEEEAPKICACGSTNLTQEEDVLDTWFSSAIWPFSTMGWPEKTKELAMFYPTSVLVTGFDILFFWVARMMMLGLYSMKQVPFHHVYLHALVRDAQGQKMSKSGGNAIDPLDMIEKYGTDALRFTLTAFAAMGRDIRLSEDRIEGYRHFVNKLWNASRFALMNLPETPPPAIAAPDLANLSLPNAWLLHRLEEVKEETKAALASYRFNDAAQGLYKFLWNEFCDWYLELIKPEMQGENKAATQYVLYLSLREILILLHPIMPFVTSEIWQALPGGENQDLSQELYPPARPQCVQPEPTKNMLFIQDVISTVRTIRAELNISPAYKLKVLLRPENDLQQEILTHNQLLITTLARLSELTTQLNPQAIPKASASHVAQGCEVIVYLEGAIDINAELARMDKEIGKIDKELGVLNQKLANEGFVSRAPVEIVQREKDRVAELSTAREKLLALQQKFKDF